MCSRSVSCQKFVLCTVPVLLPMNSRCTHTCSHSNFESVATISCKHVTHPPNTITETHAQRNRHTQCARCCLLFDTRVQLRNHIKSFANKITATRCAVRTPSVRIRVTRRSGETRNVAKRNNNVLRPSVRIPRETTCSVRVRVKALARFANVVSSDAETTRKMTVSDEHELTRIAVENVKQHERLQSGPHTAHTTTVSTL